LIAVDTNVLVYAHRRDSEWHESASRCVKALAEAAAPWALPWPCLHEFLAIVTHPRIYQPASTLAQALMQINCWCESPTLVLLGESDLHLPTLEKLLIDGQTTGPRIHDARVAAICIQHGVTELWSADRDFTRYPALATRNPLVTPVTES
jgi:toxin-antitoxin system PIN domain toxin